MRKTGLLLKIFLGLLGLWLIVQPAASTLALPPIQVSVDDNLPAAPNEIAADDSYQTDEDTPLIVPAPGVLDNDPHANSADLVEDVLFGSLNLASDGGFDYTPDLNFNGTDSFIYASTTVTQTLNFTVTLIVNAVNDAPVAEGEDYQINQDQILTVSAPGVLANDSDVDSAVITATLVSSPPNGIFNLNEDGSFTYNPDGFVGSTSFTYQAFDGTDYSEITTVNILVNDYPQAQDDSTTINEDTSAIIDVLANDLDFVGGLDNSSLSIAVQGIGTATVVDQLPRPVIQYTPYPDFYGQDFFDYEICDIYGTCSLGLVTVDISPINDRPVAVDDNYATYQNTPLTVAADDGVLINDTDVDSTTLIVFSYTQPTTGTLSLSSDGSFTYTPPDPAFMGSVTFTYFVSDGLLTSALPATVTILVTDNLPPDTTSDIYLGTEDTPIVISAPGVLINDTDPENAPLTAVLADQPTHGSLTFESDGSFEYIPNPDFFGQDTFTYQAYDGTSYAPPETVTLDIAGVNDAPVAADDSYLLIPATASSANAAQLVVTAAEGILSNDTDIDTTILTATLVTAPGAGSLTINLDGSFTYTAPDSAYAGIVSFTYQVSDGELTDTGTGTITVDLQKPTIEWVSPTPVYYEPSIDVYLYNHSSWSDTIPVGVITQDTSGIERVVFFQYNELQGMWMQIASVTTAPYSLDLSVHDLTPGVYNQHLAIAYDIYGNFQLPKHLYIRPVSPYYFYNIHLPVIRR
jgi:VCBS repeat-containing protein